MSRSSLVVLALAGFFSLATHPLLDAAPAPEQPQKQNISFEDAMIAAAFKSLAKAYVAVQDKDELVKKLRSMSEDRFDSRYARVYEVIKGSPKLAGKYGFHQQMSADELAKKLDSWDKRKLMEIIDGIPDSSIASEFKKYISRESRDAKQADTNEQICWVWNRVSRELGVKPK
jgi:hypothetical protein